MRSRPPRALSISHASVSATFANFGPPSPRECEFHNHVCVISSSKFHNSDPRGNKDGSHVALHRSVPYTAVVDATWKASYPEIILTQYASSLRLVLWAQPRQIRFYCYLLLEAYFVPEVLFDSSLMTGKPLQLWSIRREWNLHSPNMHSLRKISTAIQ